jgi:hypothetical protein
MAQAGGFPPYRCLSRLVAPVELYEHLAGRVGILRVRSALERLIRVHPGGQERFGGPHRLPSEDF